MNAKAIVAIILVILGIVILIFSGISFTTPGESVQFLGMKVETRESHFIPPIVGVIALIGGILLLLVKPRSV